MITRQQLQERVKELCKCRGTTFGALEKELDFGQGALNRWATSWPSVDKVLKVCDYFNVPFSFLVAESAANNNDIPSQFTGLSEESLKDLITYADFLRAKQNK